MFTRVFLLFFLAITFITFSEENLDDGVVHVRYRISYREWTYGLINNDATKIKMSLAGHTASPIKLEDSTYNRHYIVSHDENADIFLKGGEIYEFSIDVPFTSERGSLHKGTQLTIAKYKTCY